MPFFDLDVVQRLLSNAHALCVARYCTSTNANENNSATSRKNSQAGFVLRYRIVRFTGTCRGVWGMGWVWGQYVDYDYLTVCTPVLPVEMSTDRVGYIRIRIIFNGHYPDKIYFQRILSG